MFSTQLTLIITHNDSPLQHRSLQSLLLITFLRFFFLSPIRSPVLHNVTANRVELFLFQFSSFTPPPPHSQKWLSPHSSAHIRNTAVNLYSKAMHSLRPMWCTLLASFTWVEGSFVHCSSGLFTLGLDWIVLNHRSCGSRQIRHFIYRLVSCVTFPLPLQLPRMPETKTAKSLFNNDPIRDRDIPLGGGGTWPKAAGNASLMTRYFWDWLIFHTSKTIDI